MLRTALVLCAAVVASTQQVCSKDNQHRLCIDFGNDWLKESLDQCLAGETPTAFNGSAAFTKVSLQIAASAMANVSVDAGAGVEVVLQDIYNFKPMMVSLTCTGAKAVFHINSALLSKLGAMKQFVASAKIDAMLEVVGVDGTLVLDWAGSALTGLTKDLKTKFSVAKNAVGAKVSSWVGLMVSGLQVPALPAVVRFEGNPLDVLTGAPTCRISALVPAALGYVGPLLSVTGLNDPVPVARAMFDPCRLLHVLKNCSDCTQPEVFASFAVPVTELAFQGSVLANVTLDIEASIATGTRPMWSGRAAGSLAVLKDVYAAASGSFSPAGVTDLTAEIAFETPALEVSGTVAFNGDCSAAQAGGNRGTVMVKVLGIAVAGELEQVACGAWRLAADLSSEVPTLYDIPLRNAALDITIRESANGKVAASGFVTATGTVGALADGTAAVVFNDGDLESFTLAGYVNIGDVVKGDVMLDINPGNSIKGSGDVSVNLIDGYMPSFAAEIYVSKVTVPGEVMWSVAGSVGKVFAGSIEIKQAMVSLSAKKAVNGIMWSGAVGGDVFLPLYATTVGASVGVMDNKFQRVRAALKYGTLGLAAGGEVVVDMSVPSCPTGVFVSGAIELELAPFVFDGTVKTCTKPAAGSPALTFEGTLQTAQPFGGVKVLAGAGVMVEGHETAAGGLAWSGVITGNVELFDSSATATLPFAVGGKLGPLTVTSVFNTPGQLVTGSLNISYDGTCGVPATGSADIAVNVAGAEALSVLADVQLDVCTGKLALQATKEGGWKGPWGGAYSNDVKIELQTSGNNGNMGLGLGKRHWTGSVEGTVAVGGFDQQYSIEVDSATGASVSGSLTYDSEHVYVGAVIDAATKSECLGRGNVIIRNMPFRLPAAEAAISLSMVECGNPALGWNVTGTLPTSFVVPVQNTPYNMRSTRITIVSTAAGEVLVELSGVVANVLTMSATFNAGDIANTLRIVGGVTVDGKLSVGDFVSLNGGELELLQKDGIPEVLDALKALPVDASAAFQILLDEKRIQLETVGELFGHAVNVVALGEASVNGTWVYGLSATALRTEGLNIALDSSASLLVDVVDFLLPQSFAVTFGSLELQGGAGLNVVRGSGKQITIPAGLNLELVLDAGNAAVQDAIGHVSTELASQIDNIKDKSGAIVMNAHILSSTEIDIQAPIAGNITVGNFAVYGEAALNFRVSKGDLALGLSAAFAVRVGTAELVGSGFVKFGTGSLSLFDADLSVAGSAASIGEFLEQGFGFDGMNLGFPLNIAMDMSPSLTPTSFALSSDFAKIAGVNGTSVIGVDFENPWRVGSIAQVSNANLKDMILRLTQCQACVDGLLGTLTNITLGSGSISLNTDVVNALSLALSANTTVEIPAGIVATMSDLRLWGGVVTVQDASFALGEAGLKASFAAKPFTLGPVTVTSAIDAAQGPTLHMVLTPNEHEVVIEGQATIFGSAVALLFHVTDESTQASLALDIGSSVSVDAEYTMIGHPGSSDFEAVVSGSLAASSEGLTADATAFLDELMNKANAGIDAAQADLQEKSDALSRKIAEIEAFETEWQEDLDDWQQDIDVKRTLIEELEQQCREYKADCWLKAACPKAVWCWGEVKIDEAELLLEQTRQATERAVAKAAVAAAKAPLAGLQALLNVAEDVLDVTQKVATELNSLAVAAGGLLKNVLNIHDVSFIAPVSDSAASADYKGSITVLGTHVEWDFSAELSYAAAVDGITKEIRIALSQQWAAVIPAICDGIKGLTPACQ